MDKANLVGRAVSMWFLRVALVVMAVAFVVSTVHVDTAYAGGKTTCGGKNQPACPVVGSGDDDG
jgi:hypothetical protein